jgi:WD40 repeat protein
VWQPLHAIVQARPISVVAARGRVATGIARDRAGPSLVAATFPRCLRTLVAVMIVTTTLAACGSAATSLPSDRPPSDEPLVTTIPIDWDSARVTAATMGSSGLVAIGLSSGEVAVGSAVPSPDRWSPALRFHLGGTGPVRELLASADATILAALQGPGDLSLRPPLHPEQARGWSDLDDVSISTMAFSPDNRFIVAGGLKEVVFDTTSGAAVLDSDQVISTPAGYAFSSDSAQVLEVNSDYGTTHVLTHPRMALQPSHEVEVAACENPPTTQLTSDHLTCGSDGTVLLYLLPEATLQNTWVASTTSTVTATAATPDLDLVVGGTADGEVMGWREGANREAFRSKPLEAAIARLQVSADGRNVLATLSSSPGEITGLRLLRL